MYHISNIENLNMSEKERVAFLIAFELLNVP